MIPTKSHVYGGSNGLYCSLLDLSWELTTLNESHGGYLPSDNFQPFLNNFLSVTANVGFWGTMSLNVSDFTRYARSQKDQILGQVLSLPLSMALFTFLGGQ